MAARPASSGIARTARPTLRGTALAAAGVLSLIGAAALGRSDLLFAGLFLVVAPLAALVSIGRSRPDWEVRRSFGPDVVEAGETVRDIVVVRNLADRAVPAAGWRGPLPSGLTGERRGVLPRLEPFSLGRRALDRASLSRRIRAERRGVYDVAPLTLRRVDPFGLAVADWLMGAARPLLVTPRVTALDFGSRAAELEGGLVSELLSFALPNADEVAVREYHPGDPIRRVHWRATARHGEVMVREEERQSGPSAWLLLDTARAARDGSGDEAAFERAVELVASLGVALLEHGFALGVAETASDGVVARYDASGGRQELARALAGVERRAEGERAGAMGLAAQARRSGRVSPTFVVLASAYPTAVALGELRRSAAPAVAFLLGPAVAHANALAAEGWECVVVDPDESADIWAGLRRWAP